MKRPETVLVAPPLTAKVIESIATEPNAKGAGLVGNVMVTRPPTGSGLVADVVKLTVTLTGLPVSLTGADAWQIGRAHV